MNVSASRWVLGLALMGLMGFAGCREHGTGVPMPKDAAKRTQPVRVLDQVSGNDPALRVPEAILINSKEQLANTGAAELANINVDFGKESLIVLALGEKPTGGYWAHIHGVQRQGEVVYVQATANRPAADQQVAQALSYPFTAVIVPHISDVKQVTPEVESVTGHSTPTEEPGSMGAEPANETGAAEGEAAAPADAPAEETAPQQME